MARALFYREVKVLREKQVRTRIQSANGGRPNVSSTIWNWFSREFVPASQQGLLILTFHFECPRAYEQDSSVSTEIHFVQNLIQFNSEHSTTSFPFRSWLLH